MGERRELTFITSKFDEVLRNKFLVEQDEPSKTITVNGSNLHPSISVTEKVLALAEQPEQQKILDLEKQLEEEKQDHNRTKALLNAAIKIKRENQELSEKGSKFQSLETKLEEVTKDLSAFKLKHSKEIQELKTEILKGKNQNLMDENQKMKKQIYDLKLVAEFYLKSQKDSESVQKIKTLKKQLEEVTLQKTELQEKFDKKEQKINSLQETVNEKTQQINVFQETVKEKIQQIEEFESSRNEMEKTIILKDNEIDALRKQIVNDRMNEKIILEKLQKVIVDQLQKRKNLEETITRKDVLMKKAEQQYEEMIKILKKINFEQEQNSKAYNQKMEKDLGEARKTIKRQQEKIETLKGQIEASSEFDEAIFDAYLRQ